MREKRNARQREKRYDVAFRAKRRAADEEAFLAHNAAVMRAWVAKNKQHLTVWRKTNVATRLNGIKSQARAKGYTWQLSDDQAHRLVNGECFYCGYLDSAIVNGIDRMDSSKGYVEANCVSCCKTCNFLKKCLDAKTFVERCRQISAHHGGPGERYCNAWSNQRAATFEAYRKRAETKGLCFDLQRDDFERLCAGDCHYCGRGTTDIHRNGVDRMDDDHGYVIDNCVTCCGQCNHSKREIAAHEFISKAIAVASREISIPDMPRCLTVICKRRVFGRPMPSV